jgi:hypothetical protein
MFTLQSAKNYIKFSIICHSSFGSPRLQTVLARCATIALATHVAAQITSSPSYDRLRCALHVIYYSIQLAVFCKKHIDFAVYCDSLFGSRDTYVRHNYQSDSIVPFNCAIEATNASTSVDTGSGVHIVAPCQRAYTAHAASTKRISTTIPRMVYGSGKKLSAAVCC